MPQWYGLLKTPRIAVTGYMIIITACLAIGLSVVLSGKDFSPFDYWIEDFGITRGNPAGAIFYDTMFLLTGIFLCIFSLGFKMWYTDSRWHNSILVAGQIAGVISGLALILKVSSMMSGDTRPLVWSVSFFLSVGVAITMVCVAMILRRDENEDTCCVGFTSVALIVLLAITAYLNVTPKITEWLAALSMLAWVAMVARDMRRYGLLRS